MTEPIFRYQERLSNRHPRSLLRYVRLSPTPETLSEHPFSMEDKLVPQTQSRLTLVRLMAQIWLSCFRSKYR